MVSVLTVSKRQDWEMIAVKSLESQTMQPDKWVVVTEESIIIPKYPSVVLFAPPKTRHSNLNASLNHGLKHCTGEYVVFYQDFIELEPDCIEKLVEDAEKTGGFVTTATVDPDGKMDGRYTGADMLRPCLPPEWEANVAIAPMQAIKELGGFDEEYDDGWSWDNVNLAERAARLGYQFYIDESVKPKLHFHVKEPDADPTLLLNANLHEMKMREIDTGKSPIKLDYL